MENIKTYEEFDFDMFKHKVKDKLNKFMDRRDAMKLLKRAIKDKEKGSDTREVEKNDEIKTESNKLRQSISKMQEKHSSQHDVYLFHGWLGNKGVLSKNIKILAVDSTFGPDIEIWAGYTDDRLEKLELDIDEAKILDWIKLRYESEKKPISKERKFLNEFK